MGEPVDVLAAAWQHHGGRYLQMIFEISQTGGTSKSSVFMEVSIYKPTILGYPLANVYSSPLKMAREIVDLPNDLPMKMVIFQRYLTVYQRVLGRYT